MKIAILGAGGFIGTNLSKALIDRIDVDEVVLVVSNVKHIENSLLNNCRKVRVAEVDYLKASDYKSVLSGIDLVFHLISTTNPTCSNFNISGEITNNIDISVKILDACVQNNIKRIVFTSSGGTVYGDSLCPVKETSSTHPINTYGIQKLTIENLLYLYSYIHDLDYRVARLSNPYGPFQRPNGKLGAISTFSYKAIKNKPVVVYGDGTVVRDFIYIDDAINAIINIGLNECKHKIYNIGSGKGVSINTILQKIKDHIQREITVEYTLSRNVDLKENYLDTGRYEEEFGAIETISLQEGIARTMNFLKKMVTNGENEDV